MKTLICLSVLVFWASAVTTLSDADLPSLAPQLEPLRPFLGKTWKGEFANSSPEKPIVDVSRWERALNGKAVRVLHSVNDGIYGGETIFLWDEKKNSVTYHYFTTAGFMTVGSMSFQDGKLITHELVTGSAGGVTEVRSVSELLPSGAFHVKTEQLNDGEWQPGHEVTYNQAPDAKVVFK
jgi:hypothetical protein